MDLLARYRAGDRERVWHELRQLGDRVREPELARQAQAVCDEMALRARHNIEVIVDRLTTQGYRFHDSDDQQTHPSPRSGRRPQAQRHPPTGCCRYDPALASRPRVGGDHRVWPRRPQPVSN